MADPNLVMHLQGRDEYRTNIQSYSIASSYMTSTDGWSVDLYSDDVTTLQGLETEPIELVLNGTSQVLGRIDASSAGGDGTAVTLRGRDYIADIVECNVDPTLKISEKLTLGDALVLACGPCGVTEIKSPGDIDLRNVRTGIDAFGSAGKRFASLKMSELKPKPGEGIYQFCDRIVARHGCTIQPGGTRNELVLSSPDYAQDPLYSLYRSTDTTASGRNNIIRAQVDRDFSQYPTWTLFDAKATTSGSNPKPIRKEIDSVAFARTTSGGLGRSLVQYTYEGRRKPKGAPQLPAGQLYRLLYLKDEESRNEEQVTRAAWRAFSDRMKPTLRYTVTVDGFVDLKSGAHWAVNTVVAVNDAVLGVNERLWIESREFNFSREGGATTKLECWRPGSFLI